MRRLSILPLAWLLAMLPSALFAQDVRKPPGYLFITGWYKDAGPQRAYNSVVGPVLREHEYMDHFLGLTGINLEVIEGDWIPGRIMLIRFPSEAHVERFWWSDRYQEIQKIRAPASALDIAQVVGVPGVEPLMDQHAAYLVFLAKIEDHNTMAEEYTPAAAQLMQAHNGQLIVSATRAQAELLEGDIPNATVFIVEFPSVTAMRDYWNSDTNQRLTEVRKQIGRWSVAEVLPRLRRN